MVLRLKSTCDTELQAELAALLTEYYFDLKRMTDKPKLLKISVFERHFLENKVSLPFK